jgi:hypothetical protein
MLSPMVPITVRYEIWEDGGAAAVSGEVGLGEGGGG